MTLEAKVQRKQPVQSRSRATCDAVREATVQVLLQYGADRLTTTRVAERAGVSVGTLYQYYPDKHALVRDVRQKYFELLTNTVQQGFLASQGSPVLDRVETALDALVRVKAENLALSQALASLPGDPSQADFKTQVVYHFSEVLNAALRQDSQIDPVPTHQVMAAVAAIDGLLHFAVKDKPEWLYQDWFAVALKDIARNLFSSQRPIET